MASQRRCGSGRQSTCGVGLAPYYRALPLQLTEGEQESQLLWGCSGSRRVMIKTSTRETQVKLTVSVPPSLHVLLRGWALCEGRELTSVVLQCVELSVRQLKSNGSIPSAAIRAYEAACDERLAVGGL